MRSVLAFSLLILSVTSEYRRQESNSSNEEMDDNMVPSNDPIWWFVRSPAEVLWFREVRTGYPRIDMFGEDVSNMLQFILLGTPEDVTLVLAGCPQQLLRELLEIRERIARRNAIRFVNNALQNSVSFRFYLNHLFRDGPFTDEERPLEVVCDLSHT